MKVEGDYSHETGTIRISRRALSSAGLRLRRRMPEIEQNPFVFSEKLGLRRQKKLTLDQLRLLRMSMPAANACIDFLKNRMVSFPFRIVRTEGNKKHNNFSQKRADRVTRILNGPNQFGHTYRMIMSPFCENLLERDLGTCEVEVQPFGGVKQWGAIDSIKMRPNPKNFQGDLDSAAYFEMDEMYREKIINEYRKDEIIWANLNPQPGSFYGFSPLEVLDTIILMSIYSDKHNLKIVHPNSEKGGGIVYLGDVGKEVRAEFEERYGQFRENDPGRPMFTSGGDIAPTYLPLSDDQDMDYSNLKNTLSEIVASCYQLNLRDIGIATKRGASGTAEIDDLITQKSAIIPRMLMLQDILTVGIVHAAGGDDLALQFIVKKDESLETKTRAGNMALGRGGITLNEYRELMDETLEPYDDDIGDVPIIIAGNSVFKVADVMSGKIVPGESKEEIDVEEEGDNGKKDNFKRTTTAQTDRGVDQNWQ